VETGKISQDRQLLGTAKLPLKKKNVGMRQNQRENDGRPPSVEQKDLKRARPSFHARGELKIKVKSWTRLGRSTVGKKKGRRYPGQVASRRSPNSGKQIQRGKQNKTKKGSYWGKELGKIESQSPEL